MTRYMSICALATFVCVGQLAVASAQDRFIPANFAGLTIGKATIADVKKQLGPPAQEFDDNRGTIWMHYKDIGPVQGHVEIPGDTKTQLVWYIAIYPENLSMEAATKVYGSSFRIVRYAFDTCLDNGGEAPIYESPNGSLEFAVYPASGVSIFLEQGRVSYIIYRSTPMGAKESQCKGKKRNSH